MLRNLQVRSELGEAVAAVKVTGVPLPAFLECRRLAQLRFGYRHFRHSKLLLSQLSAVVSSLYV